MRLRSGGMDVFYIDESNDAKVYVVTAVAIPFLREIGGIWQIVWPEYLDGAKEWRRRIRDDFHIPISKELHGVKLASGRGNYLKGKYPLERSKAGFVYRQVLSYASFMLDGSIITVSATRDSKSLYGMTRLEAAIHALFQRMRRQCIERNTNGFVFFDEGHEEYRKLYRRAQIYLPTGSRVTGSGWGGGKITDNLPLNMFTKDGNNKVSKFCYFTQLADLIAYSAFVKIKSERGALTDWQERLMLRNVYDHFPTRKVNHRASSRYPDGIVRLP